MPFTHDSDATDGRPPYPNTPAALRRRRRRRGDAEARLHPRRVHSPRLRFLRAREDGGDGDEEGDEAEEQRGAAGGRWRAAARAAFASASLRSASSRAGAPAGA